MNINDVYIFLQDYANQDQLTNFLGPDKFNSYSARAQIDEYIFQRNSYESGLISSDNTDDIKVIENIYVPSNGLFTKQSDYLWMGSLNSNVYYKQRGVQKSSLRSIDIVKDNEWGDRMSSELNPPTLSYPIARIRDTQIQFEPKSIGNVEMTYLKRPTDPVWAYTVVNGEPVFDELNSTDFTAPIDLIPNITFRIAEYMGVEIKRTDLTQLSSQLMTRNGN